MTCLRCGRTVPDQILLCPECRAPKKQLRDANSAFTPEEQLQKKVTSLEKRTWRQKRRIILLVLVCLLAVALLGHAIHTLMEQNTKLSSQNTLINSQEAAIKEAQNEKEQDDLLIETQREQLTEARNIIDIYHRYTGLNPEEIPEVP